MRRAAVMFALAVWVFTAVGAQQPSPRELFERARILDESNRNLDEAVALYGQAAAQATDRELAANALLRSGLLLERRGRPAEAQRAFATVVERFGDQVDTVRQAQTRLAVRAEASDRRLANTRVWNGRDVDISGSVSPDGRFVSFVDWASGDLAIRDLASGTNRRLTNKGSWQVSGAFALHSAFSPDARRLAYTWFDLIAPGSTEWVWEVRGIGIDGTDRRTIYRGTDTSFITIRSWSPDSQWIATTLTRKDGTNQIALVSTTTGAVRVLKTVDWRFPDRLVFSPDGRFLAYDFPPRENARERDVYLIATDGTREVPLVISPADDFVLGWAHDGAALLFASDRTGRIDAWSVSVGAGGSPGAEAIVKRDVGPVWPLGMTRDGRFHFGLVTGVQDVFVAEIDPSTLEAVSQPERLGGPTVGSNTDPLWSPDGRELAFISQRNRAPSGAVVAPGQTAMVVQSADGSRRQLMPLLRGFFQPRWAPDGKSILVRGYDFTGREGLFLIDATSGAVVRTIPVKSIYDPAWLPDGSSVLYRHLRDDGPRLMARHLASGTDREVYRGSARQIAASPDGRSIAFGEPTPDGPVLRVVSVDGGPARDLFRSTTSAVTSLAWTPDSRHIVFTIQDEMWRIPTAGGDRQRIALSMPGITDVRVHPDGRRVAFRAGQPAAEVWMLENIFPLDGQEAGR